MKVQCAICHKEMSNINNRHLATHQVTAEQYKSQFPNSPLMTAEHAAKLSARSVRSNKHRRGVPRNDETKQRMREGQAQYHATHTVESRPMSVTQKKLLSELALERYANGFVHPNLGKPHSDSLKQKISVTLTGRTVGPETALKAIQTRRDRGDDLAFFRGRKHTDESKVKIGEKGRLRTPDQRLINRAVMLERMIEAKVTLLNSLADQYFQLRCNVCGYEFRRHPQIFYPSKFHLDICDQCFPKSAVSLQETEVADFVEQITGSRIVRSDMDVISPLELDIYVPDRNIAIEYCGLYWHSFKPRWYHRHKFEECRRRGIRLITVFEDEWVTTRPIVESMLRNVFHRVERVINARECIVREVNADANAFLNINHLHGCGRSQIKYGLFLGDELVSVMTFMKGNATNRTTGWEIKRFCSKLNTLVRGGASKLFKTYIRDHQPDQVTSYADLRWGNGQVYSQLGFTLIGNTTPNYWYVKPPSIKRYHRYALRKTDNDPKDIKEEILRKEEGWLRIWDCGHAKWTYTAP